MGIKQRINRALASLAPMEVLWPTIWWERFFEDGKKRPMWKKCLIFAAGYTYTVLITPVAIPIFACYYVLYHAFKPLVWNIRKRIWMAKHICRSYFRGGPMYPPRSNPDYEVKELPRMRERNLTLVLGSDVIKPMEADRDYGDAPVQQKTIDQLDTCQFWRLPPDVRERIWRYAVGNGYVHIVRRKHRLRSVYCPAKNPTDPLRRDLCLSNRDGQGYHVPAAWPPHDRSLSLLGS